MKRQVSQSAVYQRVKRTLRKSGAFLTTMRRVDSSLWRYYVVDYHNIISGGSDDLEELARDLGVMANDEEMFLS